MPFVYDSALSDEALARLIARHYPPGTDMKGNSLEQPLLYSADVDGPARYMRVFANAESMAEDAGDVERQVAFMLESWNGARRRPRHWNKDTVLNFTDYLPRILPTVEDGARKQRLTELYWYHTGLTAHLFGEFDRAATAQDKAAEFARARGDIDSAVICEEQAAYERVCKALIEDMGTSSNETQEACIEALYCLRGYVPNLDELADSTATNHLWAYGNGHVHRLLVHWLGGRTYKAQEDDLDALHMFAATTEGACFADWKFLLAWIRPKASLPQDPRTDATIMRCNEIEEKKGVDVELHALALYVHADLLMTLKMARVRAENEALDLRCSRGANRVFLLIQEARRLNQVILDLPDHGAVLLREYARQKIEALSDMI